MLEPEERKNPSPDVGLRGYVAGVLDCDGSIWISQKPALSGRSHYTLRISVVNTRKALPVWFANTFWGTSTQYDRGNEKWKTEKRWACAGKRAAEVLRFALPYLVVKREQAKLGLEFASTHVDYGKHIPDAFHEHRERIHSAMAELNKRGRT